MFVLNELWWGNVSPSERAMKDGGEYQKAINKATVLADEFRKEMSKEAKRAFNDYEDTQIELCKIGECDAFVKGVRFGVQMMLDTLLPYDSPLPQIAGGSS